LSQGFPLSPLLFLLIVEGHSKILKMLVEDGSLEGFLVENGFRITHFLYVDDVIMFGKGSMQEWKVFKDTLNMFFNATRMASSNKKSQFFEVVWY
jgi:hypothetical protein